MRTKSPSKRLTESDRERIKEVADDFDEVDDRMRHALRGAEATVCAALAHQPDERTACFRHLSKACQDINASTRRCFRRQRRDATLITYRPPFRVHETCVLDAGGNVVAMFKTGEQILCGDARGAGRGVEVHRQPRDRAVLTSGRGGERVAPKDYGRPLRARSPVRRGHGG